jgi:dihydroxyacetone kinase
LCLFGVPETGEPNVDAVFGRSFGCGAHEPHVVGPDRGELLDQRLTERLFSSGTTKKCVKKCLTKMNEKIIIFFIINYFFKKQKK